MSKQLLKNIKVMQDKFWDDLRKQGKTTVTDSDDLEKRIASAENERDEMREKSEKSREKNKYPRKSNSST